MDSPFRLVFGLLVLALPLLEIAALIKLGQVWGFWPVVLVIVATGILGLRIIQSQGLATFGRIQDAMAAGREPHEALADGALRLLAGVLLLLPGPMTDTLGLLLLAPPIRRFLAGAMFRNAVVTSSWTVRETSRTAAPGRQRPPPGGGKVIEGEFERLDDEPADPKHVPRVPPGRA